MRAVSILLLILVAVSTGFALVTALHPPARDALRDLRSKAFPEFSHSVESEKSKNTGNLRPEDVELVASIDRMAAGLDALVAVTGSGSPIVTATPSASGSENAGVSTGSVAVQAHQPMPEPDYPLPGVLLARLMPDVFPKKIENKGIFDIHIFRSIGYTTYADEKSKAKFYAFSESYGVMLTNLKLVSPAYALKETDTFFSATFFLNSTNPKDTAVRFVTELEGKAVGIELPKEAYPKFKKLLLQP